MEQQSQQTQQSQLPPEAMQAAEEMAVQLGVQAGVETASLYLESFAQGIAAKLAANPEAARQFVDGRVRETLHQSLDLLSIRGIPVQGIEAEQMLRSMVQLFLDCGFPQVDALDYARYILPGHAPSRELGAEEVDLIEKLLGEKGEEMMQYLRCITPAKTTPSLPQIASTPLPLAVAGSSEFSANSPRLLPLFLSIGLGLVLWLSYSLSRDCQNCQTQPGSQVQQPQPPI
jgi:hypothetical protein